MEYFIKAGMNYYLLPKGEDKISRLPVPMLYLDKERLKTRTFRPAEIGETAIR